MPNGIDRRTTLAGLCALGLSPPGLAMATAAPDDVALLRRAFGLMHPGLLRYNSPAQIDARFERLASEFDGTASRRSILALQRLCAGVRCGHTFINPANQSDAVHASLFGGRRFLPFQFRWLGNAMVVTADPLSTGLVPGTRVLSIDGRPAAAILSEMIPLTRADGSNDAKRRALLSVTGEDRNESFDVLHALLYRPGDRFALRVKPPARREWTLTVAAVDLGARRAMRPRPVERASVEPWWSFERRGRTAVLTMGDWAVYDAKWDWSAWLDARFEEIARAGVSGLVVDLRGNEGGRDQVGDRILAHLLDAPLKPLAYRRLVRFRTAPADLTPYLDTWDKGFIRLGVDARPFDNRFLELVDADSGSAATLAPLSPRFTGKVAVLTDAQNSSATHLFALRVQRQKLGILVGQETGGNQRGLNGGAYFFFRLPGSGLEVDLPLIGTFPDRPMPDRGVEPDVTVALTEAAIAAGGDDVLAKALALVA